MNTRWEFGSSGCRSGRFEEIWPKKNLERILAVICINDSLQMRMYEVVCMSSAV